MGAIATHAAHTGVGSFLPTLVAIALVGPIGNGMIARYIEGAIVIGELLALSAPSSYCSPPIGVVRFGDVLARLHALAKASTLGVLLILAGAAVNLRDLNDVTSVVLAGILHLLASPPASNMISRAIYLVEGVPDSALDERREPEPDHTV